MKPETQRKTTPQSKTTVTTETRTAKPEAVAAKTETVKSKLTPTSEDIARRAYELYVARGKSDGRDAEDWAQAERELRTANHRNN
ncbi:MAG: hypothetical protein JWR19_1603 [Pedosphaera sp.]|nr:hypothetical protein [Pedosphaera sp.]